ncbi:MAG: ABC transporter substrate-binding protein [Candidatus Limnocylindrales bacterium]
MGVVLLSVLLIAQVSPPSVASGPAPSATPSDIPTIEPAGLRLGVVGRVDTLDPLYATLAPERDIDALLFRGLTRPGPGGTLVGDLATSWAVTDTGHTYTFHLRDDLSWADGQPVTAADVAFTIRVLQDAAYDGPYGAPWHGVVVTTPDASTVVLRLADPAAAFLQVTTQAIVPAHLLRDTSVDQLPALGFATQPVGDGPYQLVDLAGDHARLVLGPRPAADAASAIPVIALQFYPDSSALADAVRSAAVDAADGLPPEVAAALATLSAMRAIDYPLTTLTAAVMNVRVGQPLFRDARVRAALLSAIDRPGLVRSVFAGAATVATTPFPALPSVAPPASPTSSASPSAASAAAGLTAAGWKRQADGWHAPGVKTAVAFQVVTVDAATNPALNAVAHAVVAAWTSLGLHVTLAELPPSTLVQQRLLPHDFQVAVIDMDLGLVPDLQPMLTSSQAVKGGTNLAGYENAPFDRLLATAHAWAAPAAQASHQAAVAAAFAAQLPFLPLLFAQRADLYRDTVTGPTVRPLSQPSDRLWDVLAWRLTR